MDNLEALPMRSNAETITAAMKGTIMTTKKGCEKTKSIDYIFEMTMIFTEMSREGATDERVRYDLNHLEYVYHLQRDNEAFEQEARARARREARGAAHARTLALLPPADQILYPDPELEEKGEPVEAAADPVAVNPAVEAAADPAVEAVRRAREERFEKQQIKDSQPEPEREEYRR